MGWQSDKTWSDTYMSAVKRIVGPLLLQDASLEIDRTEATDLIILKARDMRIGVRLRRPHILAKFPHQITFRYARESGAVTEWSKVRAGWCDWFFYGHTSSDFAGLTDYWLIDLDAFRAQLREKVPQLKKNKDWGIQSNPPEHGQVVTFLWFDTRALRSEAFVSSRDTYEREANAARI
jgi:hypothetical protein